MEYHIIKVIKTRMQSSKRFRQYAMGILTGVVSLSWIAYWLYAQRYVATEDAYINANQVQIAAQVVGPVIKLEVQNNQFVKQGQLLFEIDPDPYQMALRKATAQLAIDEAKLIDVTATTARTLALVKQNLLPRQQGDDVEAEIAGARAQIQLDQANVAQAKLNLSHTQVFASAAGVLSNMTLQVGSVIVPNKPLFVLISTRQFWVDANYDENDIKNIKPGNTAEVLVDMYPHHPFKGIVDSMSGGSGAAFSLLPPENATGNWVKVAQRVPVKVIIVNPSPAFPLVIGTTATVTVDTDSRHK